MMRLAERIGAACMAYPLQTFALVAGVGYIVGGWLHVAIACAGFLFGYTLRKR